MNTFLSFLFYFVLTHFTLDTPGRGIMGESVVNSIHPVILIPGVESSRLEGKLRNRPPFEEETTNSTGINATFTPSSSFSFTSSSSSLHSHLPCKSNSDDWFFIWIDIAAFVPVDCWINNMKLFYNKETRQTNNFKGVYIRPSDFGNTSGVETLTPVPLIADHIYMKPLVDRFTSSGQYKRGHNIRAAPYDFRKAPNEQSAWMEAVKELIENTYHLNGRSRVVLIAHSMGALFAHIFLTRQTPEWKEQFIHEFISIGAPYGGSLVALKTLATGRNFGIIPFRDDEIRNLETSYPVVPFLLPSKLAWSSDDALVVINSSNAVKTIRLDNYNEWFSLLNLPNVAEMYFDVKDLLGNLQHPGVNVTCIYSHGSATVSQLFYEKSNDFPSNPHLLYSDGDGSVNRNSLEACLKWSTERDFTFKVASYPSYGHVELLKAPDVIESIFRLVSKDP